MARSKQATPIRRQTSSEYFSKADTLKRTPSNSNGAATSVATKEANGKVVATPASAVVEAKEAGALQILIAVGGIYASLYVLGPFLTPLIPCPLRIPLRPAHC